MSHTITEKFLLLAIHPTKGRFAISGVQLQYGTIGAMMLDLANGGHLEIKDDYVVVKASRMKGNMPYADMLSIIKNNDKKRKMNRWINNLARKSRVYRWSILDGLKKQSKVKIVRKKFIGIFPYRQYYVLDKRTRDSLISELRAVVMKNKPVSKDTGLLLGMVEACKMYPVLSSDKKEQKLIKAKLKKVLEDNPMIGALDKTIKQVQAAVISTVITTSVAASS